MNLMRGWSVALVWWAGGCGPAGEGGADASYSGTVTLDEYDWFGTPAHVGVIEVDLARSTKRRAYEGSQPFRHASGATLFRQPCGANVHRIARGNPDGTVDVVSPCSSEIENPGASDTFYGFSQLSPNGEWLAVEALFYQGGDVYASTVVFEPGGDELIAVYDGASSPTWTHDNRLLLTGEGFFLANRRFTEVERIDDGTRAGAFSNPRMHPTEDWFVFEYNQQIWGMNLDGSDTRELVFGGVRLRYPTFSPDGEVLVYLGTPGADRYEKALFFTDLGAGTSSSMDLTDLLDPIGGTVPNGPLTWW